MKNDYEIRGDVTAIILISRKHGRVETLIETADLPRACEYTGTWFASWSGYTGTYYVHGNIRKDDGKMTVIGLHRWILRLTDGRIHVDHKWHDTLDNRRGHLNTVTQAENNQNLRKRRDSSSGVTGVTWRKDIRKWRVRININGHETQVGLFENKEDAISARRTAETEYYTYKRSISELEAVNC